MLKYLLVIIGLLPTMVRPEAFPSFGATRTSCDSLWIERNQILNVAGYCFESALGQAVFDNSDCTPGTPALAETALNRISQLQQVEERRGCEVNTERGHITINGRYGPLRFGESGLTLGRWGDALRELDVFPRRSGRARSCTVSGLSAAGDNFLALRSGPDVRYPRIGRLVNGEVVLSTSACMGRWCFADSVQTEGRTEQRNGWFHVRWCQP